MSTFVITSGVIASYLFILALVDVFVSKTFPAQYPRGCIFFVSLLVGPVWPVLMLWKALNKSDEITSRQHKYRDISHHIYTPRNALGIVVAGGLLLAAISMYIVYQSNNAVSAWLLILLIASAFSWWGFIFMTQTYLIVSKDGITLRRGKSYLFTTWDNIKGFNIVEKIAYRGRYRSRSYTVGIQLYNSVHSEVTGFIERLIYNQTTRFISLDNFVLLPLNRGLFNSSIDEPKLAETNFGRDVMQYAPHLLGKMSLEDAILYTRLKQLKAQQTQSP